MGASRESGGRGHKGTLMACLDVRDVMLTFKDIAALMGWALSVELETIALLIGPVGTGKNSILNGIRGR